MEEGTDETVLEKEDVEIGVSLAVEVDELVVVVEVEMVLFVYVPAEEVPDSKELDSATAVDCSLPKESSKEGSVESCEVPSTVERDSSDRTLDGLPSLALSKEKLLPAAVSVALSKEGSILESELGLLAGKSL